MLTLATCILLCALMRATSGLQCENCAEFQMTVTPFSFFRHSSRSDNDTTSTNCISVDEWEQRGYLDGSETKPEKQNPRVCAKYTWELSGSGPIMTRTIVRVGLAKSDFEFDKAAFNIHGNRVKVTTEEKWNMTCVSVWDADLDDYGKAKGFSHPALSLRQVRWAMACECNVDLCNQEIPQDFQDQQLDFLNVFRQKITNTTRTTTATAEPSKEKILTKENLNLAPSCLSSVSHGPFVGPTLIFIVWVSSAFSILL